MIIVLILIAWLTVVAVIVNACRSAAQGDRILAQEISSAVPVPQARGRRVMSGGVYWAEGPAVTVGHAHHVSDRSRARGVRARGGHCAAGS
jgi:hypothetical protein